MKGSGKLIMIYDGTRFGGCSFDCEMPQYGGYTYERDNGWMVGWAVYFRCEGGRELVGAEEVASIVAREAGHVVEDIAEPAVGQLFRISISTSVSPAESFPGPHQTR